MKLSYRTMKAWGAKQFTDKSGNVVLWQWPNLPLYGWALSRVAAYVLHDNPMHVGFSLLGDAFLAVWAYLEITDGTTTFRRVLGGAVALGLVYHLFTAYS
jgi:hypothetical protein